MSATNFRLAHTTFLRTVLSTYLSSPATKSPASPLRIGRVCSHGVRHSHRSGWLQRLFRDEAALLLQAEAAMTGSVPAGRGVAIAYCCHLGLLLESPNQTSPIY